MSNKANNQKPKSKKTKKFSLEKIPYYFWALTAVSLGAGLLSMFLLMYFEYSKTNNRKIDYPVYVSIMQESGDQQPIFYKKVSGAWYVVSGTTEMIISLYEDGYFTWESIDSNLKYTKLYAAGRYAKNDNGQLLFSHMKELGYPFDRSNPALKTHFLILNETAFDFDIKDIAKSKYEKEKTLIIDIPEHDPEKEHSVSLALSSFMKAISKDKKTLYLKYIGTPIIENKRKLRKPS